MKYVDEYRTADVAQHYAQAIERITTRPWTIMEICGGQTHAIVKFGIDQLLPKSITLIHGPGCPVCVTPVELIDQACAIAVLPNVIFCSFGDMLRVPGSHQDLLTVKALGGDVRMVYSPLDALKMAQAHPDRQVVFFAVGFETTAPATAIAVHQAKQQNVQNFSLLVAHVLVPPAIKLLLSSPNRNIDAFLAAGHVCTVMGYSSYESIAQQYHVPIVVTGFEPADILQGIYLCVQQLEAGQAIVENQYVRAVQRSGNQLAQQLMQEVFTIVSRNWRGIGVIPHSGLELCEQYADFDASLQFETSASTTQFNSTDCISGSILQGIKKPYECTAFGTRCTPEHPLGAPMVSSEGACAAYYRYNQEVRNVEQS
jgi:hydrogenase expression/formation protein HypD